MRNQIPLRLGLNIDHVATIRNARGGTHPEPERAASLARSLGVDGLTVHLREDRRHINEQDLKAIRAVCDLPINLEMAATTEMCKIATEFRPEAVCLVPEKREERTTEGGLNVAGLQSQLAPIIDSLQRIGSRVSLFIEPDPVQLKAAEMLRVPVVELHTGAYANMWVIDGIHSSRKELSRIKLAAEDARSRGIEPHAGHGLNFNNVTAIAAIPELAELNIGHFLIGESVFCGLEVAVKKMKALMHQARFKDMK